MRSLAVLALVAVVAAGACGGTPVKPGRVPPNHAVVQIASNVKDALVYVDGRFEATLDRMRAGIAVTPGVHRFELRHDDYFSSYLELTLERAERRQVTMEMAPVLP